MRAGLWHRMLMTGPSGPRLRALSVLLYHVVPFNRPHRVSLHSIGDTSIEVKIPLRRANMNHLRGMHACALATAGEYSTGLLLLRKIDPLEYRLIMKNISVSYTRQARSRVIARAELPDERLRADILQPLEAGKEVDVTLLSVLTDTEGREVCSASVSWQIKSWSAVKKAKP